jgi:prophage regulatory protein
MVGTAGDAIAAEDEGASSESIEQRMAAVAWSATPRGCKRFPMNTVNLPAEGFLRLPQILGCKRRGIAPLIPVCKSTWHAGVRSGRFPSAVKLGVRATAWRVIDIKALIESMSS